MRKTLRIALSAAAMVVVTAGAAFAQEASVYQSSNAWAIFLGAGIAIAIAACGAGIGMGRAIDGALQGVSRNPSVAPRIMTMMILGLALIESLAIYALVISLLLLYAL